MSTVWQERLITAVLAGGAALSCLMLLALAAGLGFCILFALGAVG